QKGAIGGTKGDVGRRARHPHGLIDLGLADAAQLAGIGNRLGTLGSRVFAGSPRLTFARSFGRRRVADAGRWRWGTAVHGGGHIEFSLAPPPQRGWFQANLSFQNLL